MLLRLLDLPKLPFRRNEDFFLRVLFRETWMALAPSVSPPRPDRVEPEKELDRCILLILWFCCACCFGSGLSMMELPRWLASHSSVNLPASRVGAGA